MTEQSPPAEQQLPRQEHAPTSPADRVKDAVVGFLKSRLPGEKTKHGMELVDKLTNHLPEEHQELVTRLRPVIQKSMYAGNVVGTTAEAVLVAAVALGGAVVVKEALRIMPNSNKRKGLGGVLEDINVKAMPSSLWQAIVKKPSSVEKPVASQTKQATQHDVHAALQTKEALIAQFLTELGNPPKGTPYWNLQAYFKTADLSPLGNPWSLAHDKLFEYPYFWFNGPAAKAFIDDANEAWREEYGSLGPQRTKKTDFAVLLGGLFDNRIMHHKYMGHDKDTYGRIEVIPKFIQDGNFSQALECLGRSVQEIHDHEFGEKNRKNSIYWQDGEWFMPIWRKLGFPGLLRREHWIQLQAGLKSRQS